jgi:hypothetical protein
MQENIPLLSIPLRALIVVIPLFALCNSSIAEDQRSSLVSAATSAARAGDAAAFTRLYCDPTAQTVEPNESVFKFFTRAYTEPPLAGASRRVKATLAVCYETPTSKEMCQLFAVGQLENRLCIMNGRGK